MKKQGWQCHVRLTSSGQVAGVAKCFPQSQADVIFGAMDALVRILEDDLIAMNSGRLPCRSLARLI